MTRALPVLLLLAALAPAQDFSAESARNSEWSKAAGEAEAARDRAKKDAEEQKRLLDEREKKLEALIKTYDEGGLERETVLFRLRSIESDLALLPPIKNDFRKRADRAKAELERIVDVTENWEAKLDALAEADPARNWSDLRQARADIIDRWVAAAEERSKFLQAGVGWVEDRENRLTKSRLIHQANNITMRSPTEISWGSVQRSVQDLPELVLWVGAAVQSVGGYFATEGARAGVVRWLVSTFIALLAAFGAALFLRKLAGRLELADEMARQQRVFRNFARFGRRAIHLALIYFVPESATAILPSLPEPVVGFLDQLARLFVLLYLVWALYRELLRPDKPDRAILRVDDWARRRISYAIHVLIGATLVARPLEIGLRVFGYENTGAAELLEGVLLIVAAIVLSGIVFRKRLMSAVLPEGEATWARVVRALVQAIRPILALLMPTVAVLHLTRFELLADALTSISVALLGSIVATALLYQVVKALLIGFAHRVYGEEVDEEDTRANATLTAGLFLIRFGFFLFAVWLMTWLADSTVDELRLALDVPLPFQSGEDAPTYWKVFTALTVLFFFLFGTRHAKEVLQYQVLERTGLDRSTQYTIATLSGYVVLAIGLVTAVRQVFNLSDLGTIVAALSVGIGFGLQEIVSNFISGIVLLFERPIRVGDTIEVGTDRGLIRQINIRATTVQTRDNVFILVPNRDLMTQTVINYGYDDPKIRLRIPVGVSYGSDPEQVKEVLLQVAADTEKVLRHPVPQVYFMGFGDSSLDFQLLAWIQRAEQAPQITSTVNFGIFKALKEAAIEIPFPQRDLHIRSGLHRDDEKKPAAEPEGDPPPEPPDAPDEDRED